MFSVHTVINPPPHQEGHERWREMEQRCHGCRECPWCSVTLIIEQITHAQPDTSWSAQTAASVPHVILRHLEGVVSHSRQRSWSCTKVYSWERLQKGLRLPRMQISSMEVKGRKEKNGAKPAPDKNWGFRSSCCGATDWRCLWSTGMKVRSMPSQ